MSFSWLQSPTPSPSLAASSLLFSVVPACLLDGLWRGAGAMRRGVSVVAFGFRLLSRRPALPFISACIFAFALRAQLALAWRRQCLFTFTRRVTHTGDLTKCELCRWVRLVMECASHGRYFAPLVGGTSCLFGV